ncbi:hypothetical protein CERSUDRAFT_101400 [Gelatoporia subvermispora B]|uniref:Uncharacterized protein n=1 Tax=Ceriporiopsis subvermispora (strain B) TaxID=914234 RepID=M2QV98_CERS8|nr:hypothetical protein CERSUDRAFT_101400 [Gelatoporia subvermispora B]
MHLPVPRDTQLRRVYHAPHALMGSYLTPTRVHFPTANVGVPGRLLPSSARMSLHRIGSFRTPYGALRKAEEVGGIVKLELAEAAPSPLTWHFLKDFRGNRNANDERNAS